MLFEEITPSGETKRKEWKDLSNLQKGGTILGVGAVGYVIYLGLKSAFGDDNIKDVPVNPDLLTYTTSGGQTMQWNPDPLSKEIFENLDGGWNMFTYPETTDKIFSLQDEQVKALYNHYNNYYASDQPTLTQLIENEAPDWEGSYQKAVTRLKSLGLG